MTKKLQGPIHFIAIGGAGMAPIAQNFIAQGYKVSGSDAQETPNFLKLKNQGATVYLGHDAQQLGEAQTVVVSSAIKDENPELKAAKERGLNVIHRSDALAYLVNNNLGVCVAGTHGKTSTSALTAVAFAAGGINPGHAIGAPVTDLEGFATQEQSKWFVAEADESDASFLKYYPKIGIVTNVEADHLDFYGTEEKVFAAFETFMHQVLEHEGAIVTCADDAGVQRLLKTLTSRKSVITYGFTTADVVISDFKIIQGKSNFTLNTQLKNLTQLNGKNCTVNLPGRHNAYNATAALIAAALAGADIEKSEVALAHFKGAARRFDFKGEVNSVRVYDDYAHHPTEVFSVLKAAREVAGSHQVRAIFQPHLYSRTIAFAQEFAEALNLADECIVLDVYGARETRYDNISGESITNFSKKLDFVPDKTQAVHDICVGASAGDVILTIGAGDVTLLGNDIIACLKDGNV
ncbi:MAG: UDP-N-acetylmuramate--L-alanine ligase [Micrococcaceae bacterium]